MKTTWNFFRTKPLKRKHGQYDICALFRNSYRSAFIYFSLKSKGCYLAHHISQQPLYRMKLSPSPQRYCIFDQDQFFAQHHNIQFTVFFLSAKHRSLVKLRFKCFWNWFKNFQITRVCIPTNKRNMLFFSHKIKKKSHHLMVFNNNSLNNFRLKSTKVFIWTVNWTFGNV